MFCSEITQKGSDICDVHLTGGVPPHFPYPAAACMAVELLSVASNKLSQAKEVDSVKYNRLCVS